MEFFGFIFGLFELAFIAVFTIALVIGCTLDRRYSAEQVKWWTVFAGVTGLIAWHWNELTFSGIWAAISSFTFWQPALIYLGLGLLYCLPEFYLAVRRTAKNQAKRWASFISSHTATPVVIDGLADRQLRSKIISMARENGWTVEKTEKAERDQSNVGNYAVVALSEIRAYLRGLDRSDYRMVSFEVANDFSITPVINRGYLSACVGAWTVFWPFYLISLVIGDLLTEIFDRVAEVIAALSGRWVRLIFRDTFKV